MSMETGEYNLKECTLRFATYNIWNDDSGQEKRAARILQELQAVRADVVGLQEVTENFYTNYLCADAAFLHRAFCKYEGEEEGLAILSKYPLTELFFLQTSPEYAYSNALNVLFSVNGLRFSLTDVHLPWDSVRRQEKQITAIDRYIHLQESRADFFVLLGDFNSNIHSSVHRYLLGEQTIDGMESHLYWDDLQSAHCARTGASMTATLDFIRNPRWKGEENISVPMVADRIYVMESWHKVALRNFRIFGTEEFPETGLCASDHYGVAAELRFKK